MSKGTCSTPVSLFLLLVQDMYTTACIDGQTFHFFICERTLSYLHFSLCDLTAARKTCWQPVSIHFIMNTLQLPSRVSSALLHVLQLLLLLMFFSIYLSQLHSAWVIANACYMRPVCRMAGGLRLFSEHSSCLYLYKIHHSDIHLY